MGNVNSEAFNLIKEDQNADINKNNKKGEDLSATLLWETIRNKAHEFIKRQWGAENCPEMTKKISEYLKKIDVSIDMLETKFESLTNGIVCHASMSLNNLAFECSSLTSLLEKKGFVKDGKFTELVRNPTLSKVFTISGVDADRVWINGVACVRKNEGNFYPIGSKERLKIYPNDSISFTPALTESFKNKWEEKLKQKENIEVSGLANDFSSYIGKIGNDPKLLEGLCTDIWNPGTDPELCAQQQCADTVVRILSEFCRKKGSDFGVNIWNPTKLVKISDFKNSRDFLAFCFPKLSASHLFAGDGWLLKEVVPPITKKNACNIDYSKIKPGDILSVKHKAGWFHAGICYNSPSSYKDIKFISGSQWKYDITDDKGKFDPKSPEIKTELSDYRKWFVNEATWKRFGWFWCKPYLNDGSESEEYLDNNDTMSIRRFDFSKFGKIIS